MWRRRTRAALWPVAATTAARTPAGCAADVGVRVAPRPPPAARICVDAQSCRRRPRHGGDSPTPRRGPATAAAALGSDAAGQAEDVTVTCSNVLRTLRRVLPWSASYTQWCGTAESQRRADLARGAGGHPASARADDVGYDWRHIYLVRHDATPPLAPAEDIDHRHPARGEMSARACTSAEAASVASSQTHEARAVQLWIAIMAAADADGVVHLPQRAAAQGHAHASASGRRRRGAQTHAPDAATARATQKSQRTNKSKAASCARQPPRSRSARNERCRRAEVVRASPTPPPPPPRSPPAPQAADLYAWTSPAVYELFHYSSEADQRVVRDGDACSSVKPLCKDARGSTTAVGAARVSLRHFDHIGRLHAISGLPQPPPLRLPRVPAPTAGAPLPSARRRAVDCVKKGSASGHESSAGDIGDDADLPTSASHAAVLCGAVCTLHDYCKTLCGDGDVDVGGSGMDAAPAGAAHTSNSRQRRGGAAPRAEAVGAMAHAPPPPGEAVVRRARSVSCFAPPLAYGRSRTPRSDPVRQTSRERHERAPHFLPSPDRPSRGGTSRAVGTRAPACVATLPRLRPVFEPATSRHWSCIAAADFVRQLSALLPPAATSAVAGRPGHPTSPASRPATSTREGNTQGSAARARSKPPQEHRGRSSADSQHRRTPQLGTRTSTRTHAVRAASASASCPPPAAWEHDRTPQQWCRTRSIGVLLVHRLEWMYFTLLSHAPRLAPAPGTSGDACDAAEQQHRHSVDLSHLYCLPQHPISLSAEEVESWAAAHGDAPRPAPRCSAGACDAAAAAAASVPRHWLVYVDSEVAQVSLPTLWTRVFARASVAPQDVRTGRPRHRATRTPPSATAASRAQCCWESDGREDDDEDEAAAVELEAAHACHLARTFECAGDGDAAAAARQQRRDGAARRAAERARLRRAAEVELLRRYLEQRASAAATAAPPAEVFTSLTLVSPFVSGSAPLRRRLRQPARPHDLAEEMKYGRVVKFNPPTPVVPQRVGCA